MSPNNTLRSPIGNKFTTAASGDALGTLRTQASTGLINQGNQGNANSSSTINGGMGNKTVANKQQRSGMSSPFKDALQKGVVSGVGMLTF